MTRDESLYPGDWLRIAVVEACLTQDDVRGSLEQVKELIEKLRGEVGG